ncbi:hypothetical protein, partial [Streptomyces badius]|uniref:hypothetical protein n=1 Tax=Streptomyces badius TaxID=1941 RepID=UPI00190A929E
ITPIRCNIIGCHWACHGVPDKYADSRARIVREHVAAEHAPTPEPSPAPAWVDGDPLMEALAAAVYEQCGTDAVSSIVVDDPRTIAAVAATVARQLLGTTEGAVVTPSADRRDRYAAAMALRDGHPEWPVRYEDDERDYRRRADAVMAVADAEQASLRAEAEGLDEALRGAISASEKAAAPPAPADRAAVLREAADIAESLREFTPAYGARKSAQISENVGVLRVADHFRALADDAAAGVQPPTTGEAHPEGCTCGPHQLARLTTPPAAPAAPEEPQ